MKCKYCENDNLYLVTSNHSFADVYCPQCKLTWRFVKLPDEEIEKQIKGTEGKECGC